VKILLFLSINYLKTQGEGKMASKSKDVRMEQLRIFEKKLDLRLQQLAKKEINKEKAQNDPLVKSLKSKIRETNVRIAAVEKFVRLNQALAQAKVQKLADLAAKKEEKSEPAPKQAEPKQKKKVDAADKEPRKQPVARDEKAPKEPKKQSADADEATPQKPKKQPAEADEATPKKPKKQTANADDATPKKRASKKKEE
jgi:hypothetical protein